MKPTNDTILSDDARDLALLEDPFATIELAPPPPPPALAGVPSRTRAAVLRLRRGALIAALVYVVVVLRVATGPLPLASLRTTAVGVSCALTVGAAIAALSLAASRRAGANILAALGAPLALFAVSVLVRLDLAPSPNLLAQTTMCLAMTCMLATGPLLLALYAFRASFAASSGARGACLGVAAGAGAAAAMDLVCTTGGALHGFVGHGVPMLVAGGIGLLGARWLRS